MAIKHKKSGPSLKDLPVGELLIKEGLITKEHLEKAIKVQNEEGAGTYKIGELLVKHGLLTDSQFTKILEEFCAAKDIKMLLLRSGKVNKEQLNIALKKQRETGQQLGLILINLGFISKKEFYDILKKKIEVPRFGEILVARGVVRLADMEKLLKIQKKSRMIGEILVEKNYITNDTLNYILGKYDKRKTLGAILLKMGYITEEQLNMGLEMQKGGGDKLGELLVQMGLVTTEQIYRAMAVQFNIPLRSLNTVPFSKNDVEALKSIINMKYSKKHRIVPVQKSTANELTVAIDDVETLKALEELRRMMHGYKVKVWLFMKDDLIELENYVYRDGSPYTSKNKEKESEASVTSIEADEIPDKFELDENTSEIVAQIIKYGITYKASDIHIENDVKGMNIRYRIDGILHPLKDLRLLSLISNRPLEIVARIKILSNLDVAERRIPQDGNFKMNYINKKNCENVLFDFRVATIKGSGVGENVTIRILDPRKAAGLSFEKLGFSRETKNSLEEILKSSAGIILITGPTGSGKTTTLYTALKYLYNPNIKIMTAEDPIEYTFPGISQIQINARINMTFATALRSFLRGDPDIILVGEIRDNETAEIAFRAAQTGHLLLSTLHTNESTSSILRLKDLGITNDQLCSSLRGVLAQRLVRKNCSECNNHYTPTQEEWSPFFKEFPSDMAFKKGSGCPTCKNTGFQGRLDIGELFTLDNEIKALISKGNSVDDIRATALRNGMKSIVEAGMEQISHTTLSELQRTIPHDLLIEYKTIIS